MAAPLRILLTGARGQLGRDMADLLTTGVAVGGRPPGEQTLLPAWRPGSVEVLATNSDTMDLAQRDVIFDTVYSFRPDVILHGGAYTAVDAAETEVDAAWRINAMGTRHLAEAAVKVGAHVVYVSTDYVFDGTKKAPYLEWDQTHPVSVYGASKRGGEQEVLAIAGASATVVRTSWVNGAHGANMVKTALRLAAGDGILRFVDDQHGCPTFTADLAEAVIRLGLDRRPGIFHVTNQGETTWFGFVRATLAAAGHDPGRVEPIATGDLDPPRPAPRPANSRLENAALRLSGLPMLPEWTDGLARLVGALTS
jgi:dTDP-4-dehydrorhamnose reductase